MVNCVCIYEDQLYSSLSPFTANRPAFELLLGHSRLVDKVFSAFGHANLNLYVRPELKALTKKRHPGIPVNNLTGGQGTLFINARTAITPRLVEWVVAEEGTHNFIFTYKGDVVLAYFQDEPLLEMLALLKKGLPSNDAILTQLRTQVVCKELEEAYILKHAWDMVRFNEYFLELDFKVLNQPGIIKGSVQPFTAIYNENNVTIGTGSVIEDFVTIDATTGPVVIDKNVKIISGTRLAGPLYIGENTQVLGGKISRSSIGPSCKVSGEISNTIFLGFSNKAHDGFLGHSVVGEWVNLGAGTTTSNLKNTYTPIRVQSPEGIIETGMQFLGTLFGDHVKTGIQSSFTSGTIVSFGANIVGSELHEKYVSPFAWGKPGGYGRYRLDKFLETAEIAMARRRIRLETDEIEYLTWFYNKVYNNHDVLPE